MRKSLNPSFPQSLSGNISKGPGTSGMTDKADFAKDRMSILEHNRSLFADRKIYMDKWGNVDIDSMRGKNLFAVNALNFADEVGQKGEKQKAVTALVEGIKFAPDNEDLHITLVEYLIEEKNFGEALDIIGKVPDTMKNHGRWLELRGDCNEGLHSYEEAERNAMPAISLDNSSAKAWNLKGLIAYSTGRMPDAEKFFRQAMEFDKSDGNTYSNLAAVEWNRGHREKALDLFERAVVLSPAVESIVLNYHSAAVSLSQLARAEETLRDAACLFPLHKRIKYVLADILLQEEKYREAMAVIEEVLLAYGINDEILSLALGIRDRTGPKEI